MNREVHVRFCESAGVRFPRATYPKLHGSQKWSYFYLYAIIDIYSRYVVGWMIADRESSALAKVLLKTTIREQGADPTK